MDTAHSCQRSITSLPPTGCTYPPVRGGGSRPQLPQQDNLSTPYWGGTPTSKGRGQPPKPAREESLVYPLHRRHTGAATAAHSCQRHITSVSPRGLVCPPVRGDGIRQQLLVTSNLSTPAPPPSLFSPPSHFFPSLPLSPSLIVYWVTSLQLSIHPSGIRYWVSIHP